MDICNVYIADGHSRYTFFFRYIATGGRKLKFLKFYVFCVFLLFLVKIDIKTGIMLVGVSSQK